MAFSHVSELVLTAVLKLVGVALQLYHSNSGRIILEELFW